jgi:hypothetical protein
VQPEPYWQPQQNFNPQFGGNGGGYPEYAGPNWVDAGNGSWIAPVQPEPYWQPQQNFNPQFGGTGGGYPEYAGPNWVDAGNGSWIAPVQPELNWQLQPEQNWQPPQNFNPPQEFGTWNNFGKPMDWQPEQNWQPPQNFQPEYYANQALNAVNKVSELINASLQMGEAREVAIQGGPNFAYPQSSHTNPSSFGAFEMQPGTFQPGVALPPLGTYFPAQNFNPQLGEAQGIIDTNGFPPPVATDYAGFPFAAEAQGAANTFSNVEFDSQPSDFSNDGGFINDAYENPDQQPLQ